MKIQIILLNSATLSVISHAQTWQTQSLYAFDCQNGVLQDLERLVKQTKQVILFQIWLLNLKSHLHKFVEG